MAFKTMKEYQEQQYGNPFMLRNDGDSADVIILYQSIDDVMIGEAHYIKAADFSGYVQCNGKGCAACGRGLRVQTKLFIPLYNIEANEIQFFDRNARFQSVLMDQVFKMYPNPCNFVWRITRHGAAGSVDTTYSFVPIARNTVKSYFDILNQFGITFPEGYGQIAKECPNSEIMELLGGNTAASNLGAYAATPRGSGVPADSPVAAVSQMPDYQPAGVDPAQAAAILGGAATPVDIPEIPEIENPPFDADNADGVDNVEF